MADVTGDIGGQPVQLNNAATEATLKQLVMIMAKMGAKGGGAGGDAELKKLYEQLKNSNKQYDKDLAQRKKLEKEKEKELKQLQDKQKQEEKLAKEEEERNKKIAAGAQTMGNLFKTAGQLGQSFFGLMSSLASMGDDVTKVGGVLGKIPVVGGLVGGAFDMVAGSAVSTYKAFNTAASVGANFGASVGEMQRAVAGTGMPLDQFTALIAKNSQAMSVLGEGTADGARRFAQLSKTIRTSSVGNDLARLGYTTEDINSGMAKYASMLSSTGKLQGMSNAQLVASTGEYLKNLDAVSKLTGQSKAALQEQEEARKADAQYLVLKSKLGKEGGDNLEVLMNSLPAEMQDAAKEILATGTASGANAQKLMAVMPQIGQQLMGASAQMRATGGFSKDAMLTLQSGMKKSSEGILQNSRAQVMGTHMADEYGRTIVGLNKLSQQQGTLAEQRVKSDKDLAEAAQGVKDGLDPAAMKENMAKLADVSNQFMAALANSGIMEQLLDMFNSGMTELTPILLDGLEALAGGIQWLGENFDSVTTLLKIGAGLYIAYNAIVAAATLATSLQALAQVPLIAGLASLAGAVITILAPLMAVTAVVALMVLGFKKLYDSGWTFGTAIDAIKDNLKRFWLTLQDLMTSVLSMLPSWAGGISKDEAARRKAITDDERKTLDAAEKARDAKRAEVAATRSSTEESAANTKQEQLSRGERWRREQAAKKAGEDNTKVTQENTAAKKGEKESADAVTAANKNLDGTNPAETFKDYRKRMLGEKGAEERPTQQVAPATPSGGNEPAFKGAQKEFYDKMYATLLEQAKKQGVANPEAIARLGASQSSLETGFGKHTAGSNNFFGIKARPGEEGSGAQSTKEFINGKWVTINDKFRKYNNMEESAADYVKFLQENKRYKGVLAAKTADEAIAAQGKTGYATDPGYAAKLASINARGTGGTLPSAPATASARPTAPATPTPQAAQAAAGTKMVTIDGKQYAEGSAEAKAAQEAFDKKQSSSARPQPTGPKAGQESAETLLADLNTKMETLIKVSAGTKDLNDKQLTALRGRGDAFQMGIPI